MTTWINSLIFNAKKKSAKCQEKRVMGLFSNILWRKCFLQSLSLVRMALFFKRSPLSPIFSLHMIKCHTFLPTFCIKSLDEKMPVQKTFWTHLTILYTFSFSIDLRFYTAYLQHNTRLDLSRRPGISIISIRIRKRIFIDIREPSPPKSSNMYLQIIHNQSFFVFNVTAKSNSEANIEMNVL